MKIPVWFKALETGEFDIVCAELCGWGHYKMKGRITIESRADFDAWLEKNMPFRSKRLLLPRKQKLLVCDLSNSVSK